MIRTNNISLHPSQFANESGYILGKVLTLEEELLGQSHSITSIFQQDTNPSMVLFVGDEGYYRFKDFSSGKYGDFVDIVQYTHNLPTRIDALKYISNDLLCNYKPSTTTQFQTVEKKIVNIKLRRWIVDDEQFWKQFGIIPKQLLKYNIKPISSYSHQHIKNGKIDATIDIKCNGRTYGYFDKNNVAYKIYNPGKDVGKYLKVKDYIQGYDQLTFDKSKILIICASMKDFLSLQMLNIGPVECIACESENVLLEDKFIKHFRKNYVKVYTLFDNDVAGMKNMKLYYDMYGIHYIHVKLEKDIAEAIQRHGTTKTKEAVKSAIKETKNRENSQA